MTYHDAYIMAYEKCKQARDSQKQFIEIQHRATGTMLLAQRHHRGSICIGQTTGGICAWATKITNRMVDAALCDLPMTGEKD